MLNSVVISGLQPEVSAQKVAVTPKEEPSKVEATEAQQTEKTEQSQDSDAKELRAAVSKLNDHVQNIQRTLTFAVEDSTGHTVVQVFDSETDELIRQIPTEETIKLAASIEAFNASLLIQEQA